MTTYKRNNKTHKSKKNLLTYLDLLLNNNPHNSYDGWTMPTLQMLFNSGSFWQNPSLGLNLSLNTNLGLGLNSMYNLGLNNTPKLSMPSSSSSGKGLIGNSSAAPVYGAAAGMGFDTVDTLLAGGKKTGLGTGAVNAGATLMTSGLSSGNPSLILAGGIAGTAGTIYNAAFGSKKNEKRIALAENEINAVKNFNANASNFDDLLLLIMNAPVITGFSLKDIGSNSLFNKDATKEYNRLNDMREFAEAWKDRSIANAATNLLQLLMDNLLLNYTAYGGLLDMNSQYSDGGKIYIKPENRGKFTALKERTGKSATWFKEHGTPALKKMATFALNSRKWKHDDGGPLSSLVKDINERSNADFVQRLLDPNRDYILDWESDNIATHKLGWATDDKGAIVFPNVQRINGKLYDFTDPKNKRGEWDALDSAIQRGDTLRMSPSQAKEFTETYKKYYPKGATFKAFGGDLLTNGTVFSNNVIEVNNGGTHEENPMEGVLMGVDSLGIPNLVEEGETIWNDYVFSNRIPVPDAVRNKYKLRGTKDMTFSDAAKKILKASEERPNDPIANDTLNINLTRLANEQEVMRELKRKGNKYKKGGKLNSFLDAYNDWVTNPYNTATTGFGEGLDVSPNLAASREKAIKNTIDYNKETDDLIARDNLLRYAPAFGSALGVGYGLLSKPNYSRADALALFAQNAGKVTPISYDPLGDFLTYRPTDMNHIANRMAALAGATRRNIMNTSGGNRANAIGSLLAADYNSQIALADALRQGEDTNWNRYMQAMTFNRGTKLYNSEAALKAAMANQEARLKASQLGLSGYTTAMKMKDDIDALRNASISANFTNLFDSLGDIGREEVIKKMVKDNPALLYDYFGRYKGSSRAKGGKINRKKRGGFTY